jgi:hypothetical protein
MAGKFAKLHARKRAQKLKKEIADMFAEYDFHAEREDDHPRREWATPISLAFPPDEENPGMEGE